ncbi:hypothetical protein A3A54_01595 [Candidatus Curtissbacteria bacterium RIFCSPLOWO2_01_FULL_39_62]|uniref:SpoVT-AbrB domain-containing protein n=2 Tax=Candidatus Curtissiibacteriota TaxID=1752717 RepID=A0A1F5G7M8_9BACT|nr:MAG: hypothetical protein A2775_00950 [Candidatus Curtissbacteria bacterium RIFCSPHIGHO2_01_FULL_39_57]OGD87849.1 MAG: hypothetical protein A3D04_02675 [Candidatus Curtissbacteria bacterium RIFCSPHIGHO2_02_FULL_40_16b]OGD90403.1 MAG: hypothetical protein A3E11_00105 [Candidatus Curtissbacteria bacterium RIFCSPHIGHO2_12_FULL_38_37]OGD99781.1 MAG: hypothetical protein A3J17_04330 [Candidatus Curtissbacteria bacterium RIFCSPLOWO2_02_FULL_40_11]OGE00836.1 MAG: hypothetical protein A3A54_01595 [C
MHFASVTSQGQVSIPAKIRKKLKLDKRKRVIITEENGKILMEPIKDILELAGSLKAPKNIKAYQGREAFENYLAHRANKGISKKALKQLGFQETSPHIFTPPKTKSAQSK